MVTSSSPAIIRNSVDLPHPDGPTMTNNSPSPTSRSTSRTAQSPVGKRLLRCRSSSVDMAGRAPSGPDDQVRASDLRFLNFALR